MDIGEARPDRDQDAAEADQDSQGAPPADPFAEHRAGQHGHHERRQKADGSGLVEPQMLERKKVKGCRSQQQERTHDLRFQSLRPQQARYGKQTEHRDHGEELAEKPHPYNLGRWQVGRRSQIFGGRVETGKKCPCEAHEADSPKGPRLRIAQVSDGCGGFFLHRLERWALAGSVRICNRRLIAALTCRPVPFHAWSAMPALHDWHKRARQQIS